MHKKTQSHTHGCAMEHKINKYEFISLSTCYDLIGYCYDHQCLLKISIRHFLSYFTDSWQ